MKKIFLTLFILGVSVTACRDKGIPVRINYCRNAPDWYSSNPYNKAVIVKERGYQQSYQYFGWRSQWLYVSDIDQYCNYSFDNQGINWLNTNGYIVIGYQNGRWVWFQE